MYIHIQRKGLKHNIALLFLKSYIFALVAASLCMCICICVFMCLYMHKWQVAMSFTFFTAEALGRIFIMPGGPILDSGPDKQILTKTSAPNSL